MLADIRDYIASLGIARRVYMGKLDAKEEESIGVYGSKHQHAHTAAIGGQGQQSYGMKYVTFLVHWNKSPRDTEKAADSLFQAILSTREDEVNGQRIKFIQPLVGEPVNVGTDEAGIYEMVVEAAVVHERKGEQR